MPKLVKLNISGLRNLEVSTLLPSSGFNLIFGENGSGKTSLLEAIYLLGRAKTFRSASRSPILQEGAESCVLHAQLQDGTGLGFSRNKSGEQDLRVNTSTIKNQAELVDKLPLQLINAEAFKILEGGPSIRRSFLDWGVFHVEHQFLPYWQGMQRALANRNALLKANSLNSQEIAPWTQEFCQLALQVHGCRESYMQRLQPYLANCLEDLLPDHKISLSYECGWDKTQSLQDQLATRLEQDRRYGHTGLGPHRADIKISVQDKPAADLLSRGQQKLLVIAMKIAQAALLAALNKEQCLFLIDDLPAELDSANRTKVLGMLQQSGEQVFVTGIEAETLLNSLEKREEARLFHVKHGKIRVQESTDYGA